MAGTVLDARDGNWQAPFIVAAGLLVIGAAVWAFWLDPDASVVEMQQARPAVASRMTHFLDCNYLAAVP